MLDGIHHSQKDSSEAKQQSIIAQEILSYLEDPNPTSMTILRDITIGVQGNSGWSNVYEIVLRLNQNNTEEWQRFYNSSALASQSDDFKNRFLSVAQKKAVEGF